MSIFFSKETNGFYSSHLHGSDMPADAKEIEQGVYDDMMGGASLGKSISSDDAGYPVLVTPEPPSELEKNSSELSQKIAVAERQIGVLKPAVDGGYAKPGHDNLLLEWQKHLYELTSVPNQVSWPNLPKWPNEPIRVL